MSGVDDIGQGPLSLWELERILREKHTLELTPETEKRLTDSHNTFIRSIEKVGGVAFDVPDNTVLSEKNKEVPQFPEAASRLILSQAAGSGPEVPEEIIRLMLFLKIRSLASGQSGVSLKVVKRLLDFYNREVYPVVYEQGAAGLGEDSVALAHLALPLIGKGEVRFQSYVLQAADVLSIFSWEPLPLSVPDANALLSGSHFTLAYGIQALLQTHRLAKLADAVSALSFVAFQSDPANFSSLWQQVNPPLGEQLCANTLRSLLGIADESSQPNQSEPDPDSFRCISQVHGASHDCLDFVFGIFENQLQTITETPAYFLNRDLRWPEGDSLSQPLSIALEVLSLAIAGWAGIAERRIAQLISGQRGLPPYLQLHVNFRPGFWSPHQSARSHLAQIRFLSAPASAIPLSPPGELADLGNNGPQAALKALTAVGHLEHILAAELFTASQALTFRESPPLSSVLENWLQAYREHVSYVQTESPVSVALQKTVSFLQTHSFPERV